MIKQYDKIEDLNLSVFNMITWIDEWKILKKQISCECECRFEGRKCNSDQWWNNDKCWCECKKRNVCEKDSVWNRATCNCENGKYLASIMDNSAIICDKIIEAEAKSYDEAKSNDEETKASPTNFNEKNITYKKKKILYFTNLFINYHYIIDSC